MKANVCLWHSHPLPRVLRVGRRAWRGLEACWRLACPEPRLSSFLARGHGRPIVTESGPVVSGLSSWSRAQLGVENFEHFALRNRLRQKHPAGEWCSVGPCLSLSHSHRGNSYHVWSPCSGWAVYLRALHSFCHPQSKSGSGTLLYRRKSFGSKVKSLPKIAQVLAELRWTPPVSWSRILLCSIILCWLGPGPASLAGNPREPSFPNPNSSLFLSANVLIWGMETASLRA